MLVLAAGVRQQRLGLQPSFDAVFNYQHVTKWVARVNYVERIPEFLRRAFTYLRAGRPGPVLLEVPQDVATADVADVRYRVERPVEIVGAVSRALTQMQQGRPAVLELITNEEPVFSSYQR